VHIVTDEAYRELEAYRATGMSPEGINKLVADMLEPSPLPLLQDTFDEVNRAISEEEWNR